MIITDGTTPVTLSDDLLWSDEFNWNPVEQASQRTITGGLVVSSAARTGGRPITLEPQDDNSAWHSRATIEQLRNWSATAGRTLTLTMRGVNYSVAFRHQDGTAVEARPVVHFAQADVGSTDWFHLTLRLMQV